MVCPRVMFTLIVCQILLARVPFKRVHILCFFFISPTIPYFNCLQSLLFDGIIGNTYSCCIVAVDKGFGLWVAKIFEGEPKNYPFLTIQNNALNLTLVAEALMKSRIEQSM